MPLSSTVLLNKIVYILPKILYIVHMIQKVITKRNMDDSSILDDLAYWQKRSTEERISAVEILRRQYYGSTGRLQRFSRIVERT